MDINKHEQVFFDPHDKRKKRVRNFAAAAAVVAAAAITFFVLSLLGISLAPSLTKQSAHLKKITLPVPPDRQKRLNRFILRNSKITLWQEIDKNYKPGIPVKLPVSPKEKVVAAFYAPWQETGLHSFRANASKLTHIIPAWLKLNSDGKSINYNDFNPTLTPHNNDAIQIARKNNLRIVPLISNGEGDSFDPVRIHKLLISQSSQDKFVKDILAWIDINKFAGLNVDFENINIHDYDRYIKFLGKLSAAFKKKNLSLSVDVQVVEKGFPYKQISEQCDFVVLMTYDEHDDLGEAGPIASAGWFYESLKKAVEETGSEKLVAGIGNYAYDWSEKSKIAESITYQDAIIRAHDNHPDEKEQNVIRFDSYYMNSDFEYQDDYDINHRVWLLDAVSAYNEMLMVRNMGIRGGAMWALGFEDPSLWNFFGKKSFSSFPAPAVINKIGFPFEIDFEGEGEILSVHSLPEKGERTTEADSKTGLITSAKYKKFPAAYLIKREGFKPKKLVLTFDDGPSDDYTPQILDILKYYNVKAAFFVIGESAEQYPDIIRRMYAEGHEIGSHSFTHPNMGAISQRRAELELNSTQRAIQSITGYSTLLFRPPYNADAEPVSSEEIKPVITASRLGYMTIGEIVDPQDWNLYNLMPNGTIVKRNAAEIVDSVLVQLQTLKGNVILLHDGGGDRSMTIEALKILIPKLRSMGYEFCSISDLMNKPRNAVMPPVNKNDTFLVGVDKWIFESVFTFESFLSVAFTLAIILGIFRVLFVVTLVVIKHFRKNKILGEFKPFVSVLIAAYNEKNVITKTIGSILNSDYKDLEIIVVDDGSTDGTAEEVKNKYSDNPKVKVIVQQNGGKSTALNNAILYAKGEILFNIDADTQIVKNTISLIVRHFSNEKIGAVAGNIKVGNRRNILTKWQAIEYITSQNLDRDAYSLLNSITVVPGAVGAWRKKAVVEAGGYIPDTLAEDMDLTWRLRQNGWLLDTENEALAFTEAPDDFNSFFKQRFRWSFGTLQCLWKHKKVLLKHGWFGWLALPMLWIFQIGFQTIAPLVDLQLLYSVYQFVQALLTQGMYTQDWRPLPQTVEYIQHIGLFYLLFFVVDLIGALIAFIRDHEKLSLLWLLFWQRFVYRQLIYAVIWKSIITAVKGRKQGWGKINRKGTVELGNE
jgi:cellulose synthase/poly-beta-1,6-N-acetylglucosamine synthase-like glycosyltransferase/peptidoglycan/xylan/chitin deacetylase (PgdA/CDA1 family)/spore germination protein YaaH